jgi:hypothetical protein
MIYHSRLAWDAARVVVAASETHRHFVWLSDEVRHLLGPGAQRVLADTRHRLVRPGRADARDEEAGSWRVRFDDLLRERPDLARPLHALVTEAGVRLNRPTPYWPVN